MWYQVFQKSFLCNIVMELWYVWKFCSWIGEAPVKEWNFGLLQDFAYVRRRTRPAATEVAPQGFFGSLIMKQSIILIILVSD